MLIQADNFLFYQIRDSNLLLRLDLETQSGHFYVYKRTQIVIK